ncbi:MAG: hypothetical protein RSB39_09610, partial [Oscillospiraceae bacterium]
VTYNEDVIEEDTEKIKIKDFLRVLVMPRVWLPAILLAGGIIMYGGLGYLTPWSTEVVGISVAAAGIIGSIREYGCRVGGIGGGYMADKVLKSSAKWQVIAHLLTAACSVAFIFLASSGSAVAIIAMLFFGCAVYANRVTAYSLLTELKVPVKVAGTAIALVTLIGYVPDMFIHTMFGKWLDTYGAAGYNRIFIFMAITGVICALLAIVAVFMSKKINKNQEDA